MSPFVPSSTGHERTRLAVFCLFVAAALPLAACDEAGQPFVLADPCWAGPSATGAPSDLACTGLFEDAAAQRVAWNVRPFAPGTKLWSDGAEKRRWLYLPEGTQIDTANPDQWVFPVGTKAWKEFSLGGRRIETRLFQKAAADRWIRATYIWTADGKRATRYDRGMASFEGTGYTIPSTSECDKCHEGRLDRLLGFEAVGLGEESAGPFNLGTLVSEKRLTVPPLPAALQLPANIPAPTRAALAWLHVNCGTSCHNRGADSTANSAQLYLRLEAAQLARAATEGVSALDPWLTTVGVPARVGTWVGQTRIVPGAPDGSLLFRLATSRGAEQMPPILTHLPDPEGTRILRAFIESIAP